MGNICSTTQIAILNKSNYKDIKIIISQYEEKLKVVELEYSEKLQKLMKSYGDLTSDVSILRNKNNFFRLNCICKVFNKYCVSTLQFAFDR